MAEKQGVIKSEDIRTMKKDIVRIKSGEQPDYIGEVGLMPKEEKVREEMAEREKWEDRRMEEEQREKLERLRKEIQEKDRTREEEFKKGLKDQAILESLKMRQEEDKGKIESIKTGLREEEEKIDLTEGLRKPGVSLEKEAEIERMRLEEVKREMIENERKRMEEQTNIEQEMRMRIEKEKKEAEMMQRLKKEEEAKKELEKRSAEEKEKEKIELEEKRKIFEAEEKKKEEEKNMQEEARRRAIEEERKIREEKETKRRQEEERKRKEDPAVRKKILLEDKSKLDAEKSKIETALKDLGIEAKPLEIPKSVILKEIEDIQKVSHSIIEREKEMEEEKQSIEEKELLAKTSQEKRQIEKERWAIEEKLKELEERRWPWDEKLKQAQDKLQEINSKYVSVEMKGEEAKKRLEEINKKEEKIKIEIELLSLREELGKIQTIKKSIEQKKEEILGSMSDIEIKLGDILKKEKEAQEDKKLVEEEEKAMKDIEERRKMEKERWQAEEKIRSIEKERWQLEEEKDKLEIQLKREEEKSQSFLEKASKSIERIKDIEGTLGIIEGTELEKEISKEIPKPESAPAKEEVIKKEEKIESVEPKEEIPSVEKVPPVIERKEPDISYKEEIVETAKEGVTPPAPPLEKKSIFRDGKEKSQPDKLSEQEAIEEAKRRIESLRQKSALGPEAGPSKEPSGSIPETKKPLVPEEEERLVSVEEERKRRELLFRVQAPQGGFGGGPKKEEEEEIVKPIKEEQVPPTTRPLPKKTSSKEKRWVRIFAFVLVLVLLFGNITFWYWYFVIRNKPIVTPLECSKDSDCSPEQVCGKGGICQSPPVAVNCSSNADCKEGEVCGIDGFCTVKEVVIDISSPLFEVDDKREIRVTNLLELRSLIAQAISEWQNADQFRRIIIINEGENRTITLKEFFDALNLRMPEDFFSKVNSSFTLFIYTSQPEGGRIGLVTEVIEKQTLSNLMSVEEVTLKDDLKPLFSMMNAGEQSDITFFRNASSIVGYSGQNFRFLTLAKNDLGICYFISDQYFVLASSFNSMKKVLDRLSVAIPTVELNNDLQMGDRGDEVKLLQSWLATDTSIYPSGQISGYFGALTKEAVIKFQEKYAADILVPQGVYKGTGVVDLYTRIKLNELYAKSGVMPKTVELITDLRYGDHGDEVKVLQTWLAKDKDIYPKGIISGWFGPLTREAVTKFQEKYASEILTPQGLTRATGVIDALTRQKLNQLYGNK